MPDDGQANDFHLILTVRDNGSPNWFTYRRVIVSSATRWQGCRLRVAADTRIDDARKSWRSHADGVFGRHRYGGGYVVRSLSQKRPV